MIDSPAVEYRKPANLFLMLTVCVISNGELFLLRFAKDSGSYYCSA